MRSNEDGKESLMLLFWMIESKSIIEWKMALNVVIKDDKFF
jgi:hypothetical protein